MIDNDRKPCPFCGNEFTTLTNNNYTNTWEIRCPNCGIVFRIEGRSDLKEKTLRVWNSRH